MKTSRLGLFLCFSRFSHGQLKDCFYMEGYLASIDLPCDPEAEVSACCQSPGWRCASSLYCVQQGVGNRIGSCTDKSFQDNACPFALTGGLQNNSQPFSYAKNTTMCQDGTICPDANNQTCCNAGDGKKEILFPYGRNFMPGHLSEFSSFYALAGYTIPSGKSSPPNTAGSMSPTLTGSLISASVAPASKSQSLSPKQSDNPTPSGELERSAKTGIGIEIGIGLGIALLGCLAMILLRRHRNRTIPAAPAAAEEVHGMSARAEIHGAGRRPLEMNGEARLAELGRGGERYEI